ncbi:unnamed protein product [Adineta ricciae]|uniref:RING-type domain-containing protein n=1 Tax=Adineta ricciae TaxID=249248 RepID=A0A813X7V7_ADIRI|nr:unnamed protein product [Adineta ricciae]
MERKISNKILLILYIVRRCLSTKNRFSDRRQSFLFRNFVLIGKDRHIMSTNNQPDSSLSNEQIVANNNPITTNQTLSEDQVPTSGEVLEIDDALADQSDSWETDDEGDFYTEPTTGRLSDQDDDDNLLSLGLSKHLIECYPMSTAEEASIVGVVCDICLNEYKTHDKVRTIPCLHRFHTRCIDKWLKKSSKCPMCRSDLRKPKWYKS